MIRLENIIKSSDKYQKGVFSLNNINITFNLNQIYNIVGNINSGNKDLLLVLGLIDNVVAGSYYLNSKKINELSNREKAFIRLKEFGLVLDKPLFINTLTILENIILPIYFNKEINLETKKSKAIKLLKEYNLETLANLYPNNLTYYQKQIISLIRALINNPNYILIDNIFDEMTDLEIKNYLAYIKKLKQDNKTIIMASSKKIEDTEIDKVIYMDKGVILLDN